MIYLATPYWHPEQDIRDERTLKAKLLTRSFMRRGLPAYSPIVHGRAMEEGLTQLPFSNDEWVTFDFLYIKSASYILVCQIDGWQQSKGIQREVEFCSTNNIPVLMLGRTECARIIELERSLSGLEPTHI